MMNFDIQTAPRPCSSTDGARRRMLGLWAAATAVAALLMAGCAVGPDYRRPEIAVPAQWGSSTQAQPTSAASAAPPELLRWWTRLNDPLLDALIDEAVAGNLDVATARARIREARASYRQAGGALWPTLTASASATRSGSGTVTAGNLTATTNTSSGGNVFQAGFDASWELDLFGANRRATEAAQYGAEASEWSLRATLLTLVGDVATSYVQARGYQARLALARDTATSQQETARITRARFEAGASSGLDAANAAGHAQSTLASIPTLEAAHGQLVHGLSVLTGQPPQALRERLALAGTIPAAALPVAMGMPADVLLNRPDVLQAERQYAQYTSRVGQAMAARYPSVTLTGRLAASGTQAGDLARHSSIGWSFGPSLSVPLFNGGRLEAAADVARAQRDQYFIAYQAAVLGALKDVENAGVALAHERERQRLLQASAEQYREAATLSHALYDSGATSFLDVLTADRSLYAAQDALIQSQVSVAAGYVALNKALGGGWDGQMDVRTPAVTDAETGPRRVGSRQQAAAPRSVK